MQYTVTITDSSVAADFFAVYPDPTSFFQTIITDVVNAKRVSDALSLRPEPVPAPEDSVTVDTVTE